MVPRSAGRRKILLVSNGFYPEISPRSYRATELAIEFSRLGHDVTVISKHRDYDYEDFLSQFPICLKMWSRSRLPTGPVCKWKPLRVMISGLSRLLNILFEYPVIEEMFKVKNVLKNESNYDLIISFAVPYPVHWGVAWSRSERHAIAETWIADCGDPFMGDVMDSFKHPFYFKYLEKWFCRRADYISVPIEGAIEGYYPEFHHKIKIIPQGFAFNNCARVLGEPNNDEPTFGYAGSFIPGARDPKQLMSFLATLDIPFKFVIFTNDPSSVMEYKSVLKNKLVVRDYIPRGELVEILSKMDFLINFDNNTRRNSPSKLIDYALSGRPVLSIARVFKSTEILAFINGDYKGQMVLPDIQQYHITQVSSAFLKLLEDKGTP